MSAGDSKTVTVAPAEGYGDRDQEAVREVPRSAFGGKDLKSGDTFIAVDEEQNEMPVRIEKVAGDAITVDFNHPLAGKTLHFSVKVKDVRKATKEELSHGHAHGGDGHHHH